MEFDADDAWEALVRRAGDRGALVYAVRTTGIYCRIGCPARVPNRENVEFFPSGPEAADHGYRPCRRCRPETDGGPAEDGLDPVAAVCRRVAEADEPPRVSDIAAEVGWSTRHLDRMFRAATGVGVAAYRREMYRRRARRTLRTSDDVTAAVWDAGYRSSHSFYEQVVPTLGMTPSAYRSGGEGQDVAFTTIDHDIGTILVAATGRGVCSIRIGHDPDTLTDELRAEFPAAEIRVDDDALAPLVEIVRGLADGRSPEGELPLDIEGTAFQIRVWEALRDVPAGESVTYGEVARRIGRPEASRAVGSAVGANPVALAIPCHRVVRSDGRLGGYRWGTEVKRTLLTSEAESTEEATTT